MINLNPQDDEAWFKKGTLLALGVRSVPIEDNLEEKIMKDKESALICFDNAIKINSSKPQYWYSKGTLLSEFGKFEVALQCFDTAMANGKEMDIKALEGKAECLKKLGRQKEAEECLKQKTTLEEQARLSKSNS